MKGDFPWIANEKMVSNEVTVLNFLPTQPVTVQSWLTNEYTSAVHGVRQSLNHWASLLQSFRVKSQPQVETVQECLKQCDSDKTKNGKRWFLDPHGAISDSRSHAQGTPVGTDSKGTTFLCLTQVVLVLQSTECVLSKRTPVWGGGLLIFSPNTFAVLFKNLLLHWHKAPWKSTVPTRAD